MACAHANCSKIGWIKRGMPTNWCDGNLTKWQSHNLFKIKWRRQIDLVYDRVRSIHSQFARTFCVRLCLVNKERVNLTLVSNTTNRNVQREKFIKTTTEKNHVFFFVLLVCVCVCVAATLQRFSIYALPVPSCLWAQSGERDPCFDWDRTFKMIISFNVFLWNEKFGNRFRFFFSN